MAKNYSIDYGAKDGPILMDDDTGYEVGEAPQEKVVRQLTNLKNFGKDPKNYKPIQPTLPFKKEEIKSNHILRYIDQHNWDGKGPKPKSNAHYHEKWPYTNTKKAKAEIPNVKQFDQFDESTKPYNQKKELDKVDDWEVAKKIAKSPQEIREIRNTINQSVRNMRTTKYLSKDELKFVDRDLLASLDPNKPKPRPEILDWDWRDAPWQHYPHDDDAHRKLILQRKLEAKLLEALKTKPDPDLDKGIGYLMGTKDGR